MKNKGFIFLDVIVGIFLIGLATVSFLPILANSHKATFIVKSQGEMNYLGEHIFERIYGKDDYAMKLLSLIEDEIEFKDLENRYIEKYRCRIVNLKTEEYLWNLKIIIEPRNNRGEMPNVEISGTIPK